MIQVETRDRVTIIRIDRQQQRNALDTEHCVALRQAIDAAEEGPARCVVITGEGSAFCSGADLNQVYGDEFLAALYGLLRRITELSTPVIAAVNGPAIGAGTQLAIACDLRVAVPGAVFGVPTARLGLAVDPWTIRRLALLAGGGAARTILIGCDTLTAEDAYARGLVDRLGDPDQAIEWAEAVAELAPLTLAYNKLAINTLLEPELDPATEQRMSAGFQACWASEDFQEGRRAREAKRPPHFQGR